jgi:hypothetical protein
MNARIGVGLLSALVLVPGLVWAQPCGMGAANRMAYFDGNGDGRVTVSELQARRAELFDLADANRDGVLDAAELNNLGPVPGCRSGVFRLQRHDRNADGVVSRSEYMDQLPFWFARADLNRDAVVESTEGLPPGYGRGRCRWAR